MLLLLIQCYMMGKKQNHLSKFLFFFFILLDLQMHLHMFIWVIQVSSSNYRSSYILSLLLQRKLWPAHVLFLEMNKMNLP
jgi:hypothetical protein